MRDKLPGISRSIGLSVEIASSASSGSLSKMDFNSGSAIRTFL